MSWVRSRMRGGPAAAALVVIAMGATTTACGTGMQEEASGEGQASTGPVAASPIEQTENPTSEPTTDKPVTKPTTVEPTTEQSAPEGAATEATTEERATGEAATGGTATTSSTSAAGSRPADVPGDDEALLSVTGTLRVEGKVEGRPGNWHLGRVHITGQGGSIAAIWLGDYDCAEGEEPVDSFPGGDGEANPCTEVGVTNWQDQEVPVSDQAFAQDLGVVWIDYDGELSDWSTVKADNLSSPLVFEAVGELSEVDEDGSRTSSRPVRPTVDLGGFDAKLWQLEAMRSVDH